MENASKALIIAGAILLSILIIALGMTVYNSSSSVTEGMDMTSQEISSFNSTFLAYGGEKKGRQVAELVTKIQSNNSQYDDRQISIGFSDSSTENKITNPDSIVTAQYSAKKSDGTTVGTGTISDIRATINMTTTYKIVFDYNSKGLIYNCTIYVK